MIELSITAQQFARSLKIEKAKVFTFSGFRKTGEYEIVNDFSVESTEAVQPPQSPTVTWNELYFMQIFHLG